MQKEIQIAINPVDYQDKDRFEKILSQKADIDYRDISYRILKESLDCRKTPVYRLNVAVSNNNDLPKITPKPFLDVHNSAEVIVVGAGPCGLMAALRLIQKGLKPIIIERGAEIEQRKVDVADICKNGPINEESNYCFGEGGAGTFSDGKLYTRSNKKGNISEVLRLLVYFGADEKIMYQSHAHIGTDVLSKVIKNIRKQILNCGGEYLFNTKVDNFILNEEGDTVIGVKTSEGEEIFADNTILACGHSAVDIYQLFRDNGWLIESKPFAMGVRVEHPRELIDKIQHKNFASLLPAAEYSLTANFKDRGVFSFCMCPGGIVIPTPDKEGIMVVNGMSNSQRSGKFSNSAIVVSVDEKDAREFASFGALSLLKFQQKCEQMMYEDKRFAPSQRLSDFMEGKVSSTLAQTSYKPGLISMDMEDKLPEFITAHLKQGFNEFNKKRKGFITREANIIGLESRSSSPVRLPRHKVTLEHLQLKHLYPCGEGAGYAGGITSSALDGINVAESIANQLGV